MTLKLAHINFDRRTMEISLLCLSGVLFVICIAVLMYVSGYIDGRMYVTIYDSGTFKPAKVNDVDKPTVVEGEMS